MDAVVFRNILIALSGLSFGGALYALLIHVATWKKDPAFHTGFILVKVAWVLVAGEVFKAILVPSSRIPPTTDGYVYMTGLALAAVGFVWVARVSRKKWW